MILAATFFFSEYLLNAERIQLGCHVQFPIFLSAFNQTCIFSTGFNKKSPGLNSTKIYPVGAELLCRQIDMTELIVPLCNFENVSKINLKNLYASYI